MRLRRRRRELDPELIDDTELTTAFGKTFADDVDILLERLGAVDARIAALESRLDAAVGEARMSPEHVDVLDVQVRAARLAADLHMVTIELDRLKSGELDVTQR
jgi:hypothetical protein